MSNQQLIDNVYTSSEMAKVRRKTRLIKTYTQGESSNIKKSTQVICMLLDK